MKCVLEYMNTMYFNGRESKNVDVCCVCCLGFVAQSWHVSDLSTAAESVCRNLNCYGLELCNADLQVYPVLAF